MSQESISICTSTPPSSPLSTAVLNSRSRHAGAAFHGITFFGAVGVAPPDEKLLSSLAASSESPLLCRGDTFKRVSRTRLHFTGTVDEDTRFLFAFSKAPVGAAPWPSVSFTLAKRRDAERPNAWNTRFRRTPPRCPTKALCLFVETGPTISSARLSMIAGSTPAWQKRNRA